MDIKHRKSSKKVQNHPEARGKYGAEQMKMDIKPRKSSKKVQNHPEAREKYGAEPVRMDIKHRKSRKKSKNIRKPEGNTEPGRRKWT